MNGSRPGIWVPHLLSGVLLQHPPSYVKYDVYIRQGLAVRLNVDQTCHSWFSAYVGQEALQHTSDVLATITSYNRRAGPRNLSGLSVAVCVHPRPTIVRSCLRRLVYTEASAIAFASVRRRHTGAHDPRLVRLPSYAIILPDKFFKFGVSKLIVSDCCNDTLTVFSTIVPPTGVLRV